MTYPMIMICSNPCCHCIEHDSKTYSSLSYLCLRKSTCRVLFLLLHSMIIVVVVAIVAFVVLILAVVP